MMDDIAIPPLTKEKRALFRLIKDQVFFVRGRRVILSIHLADLYEIEPRVLVQAFKRNRSHFPDRAVFQINTMEFNSLKSRYVISKYNMVRRSLLYAFTEQGVVLLAGIIRSKRAIAINFAIIEFFIRPHRNYLNARALFPKR